MDMKKVVIYSDGAAKGNPDGPGGYGAIVFYYDENDNFERKEEFAEGFVKTTNNRMELLGAITAIESLKEPSSITLYSDSKYLVDAICHSWLENWLSNGWKTANGGDVKNKDLWERLIDDLKHHEAKFVWVKGHANNINNERCDELANLSAYRIEMLKDYNGVYKVSKDNSTSAPEDSNEFKYNLNELENLIDDSVNDTSLTKNEVDTIYNTWIALDNQDNPNFSKLDANGFYSYIESVIACTTKFTIKDLKNIIKIFDVDNDEEYGITINENGIPVLTETFPEEDIDDYEFEQDEESDYDDYEDDDEYDDDFDVYDM